MVDFGAATFSTTSSEVHQTYIGTRFYQAPEMVDDLGHSYKNDWWAVGIILYELVYRKKPFQKDENIQAEEEDSFEDDEEAQDSALIDLIIDNDPDYEECGNPDL